MSDLEPTFIIECMLSDDGMFVSLRATARFVAPSLKMPLTAEAVNNLLEMRGYGKFKVNNEQIAEITTTLAEAVEEMEDESDAKGFVVETDTIAEAINAFAEVDISNDKLKAVLSITPAQGGKDISLALAESMLEEAGVTYGIDTSKIESLLMKARDASVDDVCNEEVAEALLPVRGEDAQFIPLVDTANERVLKPRLQADGKVDMLDLGDLPTVQANTPIMRKEPPTKGTKGMDVCWAILAPDPGDDHDFKPGKGTEISKEDALILLSSISGQPNLEDRGMKVDDAIKVKAVDLSTGHITTDANLLVKGDIAEGMKVRCEGDLTVGGVIESADVRAKGNIIVGKGILGKASGHGSLDQNHTVSIKAGGILSAMFASYAHLEANGDILIAEQLLHSHVTSKSNVIVGNKKTIGSQIVGGLTRSFVSIETDILGASAGVFTRLDLSGSFELKQYEVSVNHSIVDAKFTMLENMRDAYSRFMNIPITEARNVHIGKIKNTINFLKNEIVELEQRTALLLAESEQLCHGLVVRVKKKVHPNVSIKIGHAKFKTTREMASGEVYYEDEKIHYKTQNIVK